MSDQWPPPRPANMATICPTCQFELGEFQCCPVCRTPAPMLNEPTQPSSAQDIVDEVAPRVSDVVAELRDWAAARQYDHPDASINDIIDELAQCATMLSLASATSDVSEDHWRKVDADKLNRALDAKSNHDTREAVLRRVNAHRRNER